MILGEKIERKVYVNQQNFVSDIQLLIKHSFLLSFPHELLMILHRGYYTVARRYGFYLQMVKTIFYE